MKTLILVVLLVLFLSMVIWVFQKKRKERFKRDAQIPLQKTPVEPRH